MVIAPIGQCASQMAQPTQRCGWVSSAYTLISPLNFGMEICKAPGVQSLTHIEQALHISLSIRGFCHSARFTGAQIFPAPSLIAPFWHTLPQTPHPTQRFSLIACRLPFSPVIAKTGQSFAQAVQPIQASLMLYASHIPGSRKLSIFLRKRSLLKITGTG